MLNGAYSSGPVITSCPYIASYSNWLLLVLTLMAQCLSTTSKVHLKGGSVRKEKQVVVKRFNEDVPDLLEVEEQRLWFRSWVVIGPGFDDGRMTRQWTRQTVESSCQSAGPQTF